MTLELPANTTELQLGEKLAYDSSSRSYTVWKWFAGRSLLQTRAEEGRLRKEPAIRVAVEICDALEYLHGPGVVHHELKPENTMVHGEECIKTLGLGTTPQVDRIRIQFGKPSHLMGTPGWNLRYAFVPWTCFPNG